jgi:hypothetical protein
MTGVLRRENYSGRFTSDLIGRTLGQIPRGGVKYEQTGILYESPEKDKTKPFGADIRNISFTAGDIGQGQRAMLRIEVVEAETSVTLKLGEIRPPALGEEGARKLVCWASTVAGSDSIDTATNCSFLVGKTAPMVTGVLIAEIVPSGKDAGWHGSERRRIGTRTGLKQERRPKLLDFSTVFTVKLGYSLLWATRHLSVLETREDRLFDGAYSLSDQNGGALTRDGEAEAFDYVSMVASLCRMERLSY